ncbi:MAG: HD domain-containing protein [Clostridiales bacterium]|nr:HD domain-containing protein [Clostridiales bacterium]
MENLTRDRKGKRIHRVALLSVVCVLINLLGSFITSATGFPLYMDCVGTVFVSAISGTLPGIAVGLATNLLKGIIYSDTSSIYYSSINVLIAVCTSACAKKGCFKKVSGAFIMVALLALIGGGLGGILTWFLFGFATEGLSADFALAIYQSSGLNRFWSEIYADMIIDVFDKGITVALVFAVIYFVPEKHMERFRYDGWQQTPLSNELIQSLGSHGVRKVSLRTKLMLLLIVASLLLSVVAVAIGYVLFRRGTINDHKVLGEGVARLSASFIDGDRIGEYLARGEEVDGYLETEQRLYDFRDSSPDILYIYVYQIRTDGCHVVFDLDTDEMAGSEPGEIVPFDESFSKYIPDLLAGKPIEPLITNDTYGWLLTVYCPVYDSDGNTVCYACADISMAQLETESYSFLAKQISLFLGFFILILALGLWFAEYNIIYPVNSMAHVAGAFAYDSEEVREDSVDKIKELDIHTGDEIENLYGAFSKTTEDSMNYVADIQLKNETIAKMQSGLIMVLADMVENRDKCTGDHIKKTSAYVDLIARKLLEKGIYTDQLTESYAEYLKNSAPLHDIGKITVSDLILNSKSRLTEDEFAIMKSHTTAGRDVIDRVIETVPESGYLIEAKNMAHYHHERWDGKGYPEGLKGEQIPLSARIMTVADVFDALVSRRSYKEPFPFDKAMEIIKEGEGTQFDPKIAEVFIEAADEVKKIADDFSDDK